MNKDKTKGGEDKKMDTLEEKIYYKVKMIFETYENRDMLQASNRKAYLIDMVGAMTKILKTEVNIRLQEERHHPKDSIPPKQNKHEHTKI